MTDEEITRQVRRGICLTGVRMVPEWYARPDDPHKQDGSCCNLVKGDQA